VQRGRGEDRRREEKGRWFVRDFGTSAWVVNAGTLIVPRKDCLHWTQTIVFAASFDLS